MNIENRQKLSEIIKTARGTMSQRAFGRLLGVSATAVELWERGDTVPDTENLAKLAARAGYSLEELVPLSKTGISAYSVRSCLTSLR